MKLFYFIMLMFAILIALLILRDLLEHYSVGGLQTSVVVMPHSWL